MTDHDKLREAGLVVVLRVVKHDEVMSADGRGGIERIIIQPGDLIVRPIPQPGPTVEEARKALADTVHDAVGACNGWRMSTEWVEDHKRTLDTSLDALIAAVRREAQQAQPKGGA